MVDVYVNVDEPGGDVQAGHIDSLPRVVAGDIGRDLGDAVAADRDIERRVNAVGGVDDVSAFEQEIVLGHWGLPRLIQENREYQ